MVISVIVYDGKKLFEHLKTLVSVDADYVQFGCAEWFWKREVNSYALQIEPDRHKIKDRVILSFQEALHLETVRNEVFRRLENIVLKR